MSKRKHLFEIYQIYSMTFDDDAKLLVMVTYWLTVRINEEITALYTKNEKHRRIKLFSANMASQRILKNKRNQI